MIDRPLGGLPRSAPLADLTLHTLADDSIDGLAVPLDDDVFSAANGHDAQPLGRDFGGNEPHAGDALLGGERDAQ